jgi:hypothetical protein
VGIFSLFKRDGRKQLSIGDSSIVSEIYYEIGDDNIVTFVVHSGHEYTYSLSDVDIIGVLIAAHYSPGRAWAKARSLGEAVFEEATTEQNVVVPDLAHSSVIQSVVVTHNGDETSKIKFWLHNGNEYEYTLSTELATDFAERLDEQDSPGRVWNEVREAARFTWPVKPVEMATVSISGPVDQIGLIAAAAEAQGLTIF